jgi:hypothetical protein
MRVVFACPLCQETAGRRVRLVAELDLETRYVTVADLSGCAHAMRFGEIQALTEEEERRLIEAALTAWEDLVASPRGD